MSTDTDTASERDELAKRYADKQDTTIVAACISEADFKAGCDARDAEVARLKTPAQLLEMNSPLPDAELKEMIRRLESWGYVVHLPTIDEQLGLDLEAENQRLRAALEMIATGHFVDACDAESIARTALKGPAHE